MSSCLLRMFKKKLVQLHEATDNEDPYRLLFPEDYTPSDSCKHDRCFSHQFQNLESAVQMLIFNCFVASLSDRKDDASILDTDERDTVSAMVCTISVASNKLSPSVRILAIFLSWLVHFPLLSNCPNASTTLQKFQIAIFENILKSSFLIFMFMNKPMFSGRIHGNRANNVYMIYIFTNKIINGDDKLK